jgi:hypothetical protein
MGHIFHAMRLQPDRKDAFVAMAALDPEKAIQWNAYASIASDGEHYI